MILTVIEWAAERAPEVGPPPRSVCDWLVDQVLDALEHHDLESARVHACELALIANGEREPRPRPAGVPVRERAPAPVEEPKAPAPRRIRVEDEEIVRYAREVLR